MREELIMRCGQVPWALRSRDDLDLAISRYLSAKATQAGSGVRAPATPRGGVAIIPMHGVLGQASDLADFPDTSVEWLSAALDAAMASDQVATIVLDVNSPGGSVFGIPELAAKLRAARGRKQVVAVGTGVMASAAYWLASAATEVVLTPSSQAGSIGVWAAHVDASQLYERLGLKFTLVSAGKFKTEGNPYSPLTEEALGAMQARVDEYYRMFLADVATGRRATAKQVRDTFGEGRMMGAEEAVSIGMADRVGTLEGTVARLLPKAAAVARPAGRPGALAALERQQQLLELDIAIDTPT